MRTVDFNNGPASQLKERTKEHCRHDKRKRIDSLWNLMIHLYRDGNNDFSVAKMGREIEARGIMTAQAYRNSGGKAYREIVEVFALEVGGRTTRWRAPSTTPLEQIIDEIPDLDARLRLRFILAEEAKLRAENQLMRSEMKKMQRVDHSGKDKMIDAHSALTVSSSIPYKTTAFVASVSRFLEDEWLVGHGLEITPDGTVLHLGQPITLPGFARQLKGVLEFVTS